MSEPSPEEVEAALRTLERARRLPGDDPRVVALEQGAAWLRSDARRKRRLQRKREQRHHDRLVLESAAIHADQRALPDPERVPQSRTLHRARRCYVCKQPYERVDLFYQAICEACARQQRQRRQQRADLRGRRALVTGGRIKIGYHVALKMLRDGAQVCVTTRFPQDAARRFQAEPDAADWIERLELRALDLRDVRATLALCAELTQGPALDILIHNAAQTIRRPPAYYRALAQGEQEASEASPAQARTALERLPGAMSGGLGSFYQAALAAGADPMFPPGALDMEGKPLDLRPRHTWRQLLHEIEPVELAEVWLVNVLAPSLLNSQLRGCMEGSGFPDRYIVNVSAVEGQFSYKRKMPHHPHTNMAKAALNMMTRTCGQDYARSGIYMTSVDTGWITDENAEPVRQELRRDGFLPPLDSVDGAARVYDPVVRGIKHGEHLYGVFLKDYRVTTW